MRGFLRFALLAGALALLGAGCARMPQLQALAPDGGMYRSDDAGVIFTQRSDVVGEGDLSRATFREVHTLPRTPDVLYAVTHEGVYRTVSGGERWGRISVPARAVLSLSVHPNNPDVMLAAIISAVRGRGKIARTIDGGQTWTEVFAAPSTKGVSGFFVRRQTEVQTFITTLARDPHRPEVVLAGTSTGILLRSGDGGRQWRSIRAFSQGITGLKFSPTVPGFLFIRLVNGRLGRSDDGGETAAPVRISRDPAAAPGALGDPSQSRPAASDIVHAIQFLHRITDRPERILAGTGAGLYQSDDGGVTWTPVGLPPTGRTVEIPVNSLTETSNWGIWAASGFVLYSSRDGGHTWRSMQAPAGASVRFVVADPVNAERLYLFLVPGLGRT